MSDIVQVAPSPAVFQSRHGYYPCSPETAKKMRRLNFLGYEARRRFGEWKRRDAKHPDNRRVFAGGKDGWEANAGNTAGPIGQKQKDIPKMHRVYKPWPEPKLAPVSFHGDFSFFSDLLVASRDARHPKSCPENVRPLKIPLDKIDRMLAAMEMWWAEPKYVVVES